jgi:DNA-binding NarL/FixJ family response regulator
MILRILIVSDVRVVREGLNSVLSRQDAVNVVGTVDLPHAKHQSVQLCPEVILLDAGRQVSAALVKELVTSAPQSKVVAFGVRETGEDILALAAAGTAGYICDSVKSGDVVNVLRQLLANELTCSPRAAASLYRHVGELSQRCNGATGHNGTGTAEAFGTQAAVSQAAQAAIVPLSRRELQIAQLIDCGLTNKEIGRQLGIEAATVKNHIHNICEKLNVHRRGEATARIRAMFASPTPASVPDSLPTPKRARGQNPTARGDNHADHPWTGIGQLGGIPTASAPSEAKSPLAKL